MLGISNWEVAQMFFALPICIGVFIAMCHLWFHIMIQVQSFVVGYIAALYVVILTPGVISNMRKNIKQEAVDSAVPEKQPVGFINHDKRP